MTNKYYREEIKTRPRPKFKAPSRKSFKIVDEEGERAPRNIINQAMENNIIYPIKKEEDRFRNVWAYFSLCLPSRRRNCLFLTTKSDST